MYSVRRGFLYNDITSIVEIVGEKEGDFFVGGRAIQTLSVSMID